MIKTKCLEIILDKADKTITPVPDIIIKITGKLPDFKSCTDWEKYLDLQAEYLENALSRVLPQGVYDRLLVSIMDKKVSSLRGVLK